MSLQAGWYPQDDGQERYWDGEKWTDAFRTSDPDTPATPSAPSAPAAATGRGCILTIWAVVAVLILGMVSCIAFGGNDDGPDEYDTQATCKDLVRGALKNPSTADFMDEQQGSTFVSGTVVAENALGGKVTSTYRCTLSGGVVTLVQPPQ